MLKGQTYECDRCKKDFIVEGDETPFKFGDGGYRPTKESEKLIVELCPACCGEFSDWLAGAKVLAEAKVKSKK